MSLLGGNAAAVQRDGMAGVVLRKRLKSYRSGPLLWPEIRNLRPSGTRGLSINHSHLPATRLVGPHSFLSQSNHRPPACLRSFAGIPDHLLCLAPEIAVRIGILSDGKRKGPGPQQGQLFRFSPSTLPEVCMNDLPAPQIPITQPSPYGVHDEFCGEYL